MNTALNQMIADKTALNFGGSKMIEQIEQYYTVRCECIAGPGETLYVSLIEDHPYYDEDLGDEYEEECYFSLCRCPTDLFDTIEEAEAFIVKIKEYAAFNPYLNPDIKLEIVKVTVEKVEKI